MVGPTGIQLFPDNSLQAIIRNRGSITVKNEHPEATLRFFDVHYEDEVEKDPSDEEEYQYDENRGEDDYDAAVAEFDDFSEVEGDPEFDEYGLGSSADRGEYHELELDGHGSGFDEVESEYEDFLGTMANAVLNMRLRLALRQAIEAGVVDENELTNRLFFIQYPDRGSRPLRRGEPRFDELRLSWLNIRDHLVRPALRRRSGAGPTFPAFEVLWRNHPGLDVPQNVKPCVPKPNSTPIDFQCVVRLGVSFERSGVSLASYRGAFCWHGHGRSHPLRVEEMKLWLRPHLGEPEISTGTDGRQNDHTAYAGRKGIVAQLDFHGDNGRGDHIDLWNGNRLALGANSYFGRSREIWFWPLS